MLVISSVGYNPTEYVVNGNTNITITLNEDFSKLNEVVVVGYGTQKKKDFTGAVSSVKLEGSALSLMPNMNALEALRGNVAGLSLGAVNTAGGQPSTLIRGQRSISGTNDPLILLDGVIYLGSISDINPNDIASFDILKDAVSAATYGSRSANGIIAITTKKGKSGKLSVSYNAYYGTQQAANSLKMLTGQQYKEVLNAIIDDGGGVASERVTNDPVNVDWQKELYRTASVLVTWALTLYPTAICLPTSRFTE